MKKTYFIFTAVLVASLLTGCYGDKGNYDYISGDDVMSVTIGEIQDRQTQLGVVLKITPELTGITDESDYRFAWYALRTTNTPDTISTERVLDTIIHLEPGTHTVYFSVERISTGVKVFQSFSLEVVASDFTKGWFLVKDQDGFTDVDFLYQTGDVLSDLATPDGRLEGNGVKLLAQTAGYGHTFYDEDGKATPVYPLQVFHVLSDRDVKTFRLTDFTLVKDARDFFFDTPALIRPGEYTYVSSSINAMINNGLFHGLYNGFPDTMGKMGDVRYCDFGGGNVTLDYELADMLLTHNTNGTCIVFEKTTGTFMTTTSWGSTLTVRTATTGLPLANLNYDFIGHVMREKRVNAAQSAFMLMKEKTTGQYVVFDVSNPSSGNPLAEMIAVPSNSGLVTATVMGADNGNKNIFFAKGNLLYDHVLSEGVPDTQRETLMYEFPSDETITCIDFDRATNSQLLTVATEKAGKWKLYAFQRVGSTTELRGEPLYVHEGVSGGAVRFIFPRSVNVNE